MREGPVVEREEAASSAARLRAPSARLPLAVAATVGGVALVMGVALGRVTSPDAVVPAADAQPVAEVDGEPRVEVAGAVEVRQGDLTPTGTDHLVVVAVSVTACEERVSGTGLLVAPDTIVTAAHVVGDAGLVRIDYQGTVLTGEVMGVFDDGRDLALITVPAPLDGPIAVGAAPSLGEPITIVGHPGGGARTSVVGPVTDVPDAAAVLVSGQLLAVDVITHEGMSGGPAVDADGEVVGILVASQPGTGTAIVVGFPDAKSLLDAPRVDGRCPAPA